MSVSKIIKDRGIREILHFTTNSGLTGIIHLGVVKTRKSLPEENYLEYILKYNCADRGKDVKWHNYVNLSITSVNLNLFGISKDKWHSGMDGYWCILAFNPEILTHPNVVFTTTNNIYTGVCRVEGKEGFSKMFAEKVTRWYGNVIVRNSKTPSNQPTCNQAEVLYPGELSLKYLESIYVKDFQNAAAVESLFVLYPDMQEVKCIERPELF